MQLNLVLALGLSTEAGVDSIQLLCTYQAGK